MPLKIILHIHVMNDRLKNHIDQLWEQQFVFHLKDVDIRFI
jgi:hypothetical protein